MRAVAAVLVGAAATGVSALPRRTGSGDRHHDERIGCTAIAIDGAASVDGSAFAGMNVDADNADFRLTYVPPRSNLTGQRQVYTATGIYPRWVGYGRGSFYHPREGETPTVPAGHIPQVESTYGYYESVEPLINEHGLGFGESSCAGMLLNKNEGSDDTRDVPSGILDTVTLIQVALERCKTARCAVKTMGELSEAYGFVPTPGEPSVGNSEGRIGWDDAAEAYTISDRTGEAWVFHVLGGVSGVTRSVWAAQRVPSGHMAVVANDFIIGDLPEEQTDDFKFNTRTHEAARASGLWDGKGSLNFAKVFTPPQMTFEAPAGATPIPLYAALRRWALHSFAAPSTHHEFIADNHQYSFSVKVEKSLTHRDVMDMFRYQYEGTEFDLTKGILAGPFGSPWRLEGKSPGGTIPRGISITRTLYGIIAQSGPERQIGWYSSDAPTTSVYVPLLVGDSVPGLQGIAEEYSVGHHSEFSRQSAWWAFNFVSNFMNLNFRDMSAQDVYPLRDQLQDMIDEELASGAGVKSADEVADWQRKVQERVASKWWNMSDYLIFKYNDGCVNAPSIGSAPGYPKWFTESIGFSNDVHPVWVRPAALPAPEVAVALEGAPFVPPTVQLPRVWNHDLLAWSYTAPEDLSFDASSDSPWWVRSADSPAVALALLCGVLSIAVGSGYMLGVSEERRRSRCASAREPLL